MTQDDIIKAQHEEWIKHALTQTMLRKFEEQRAKNVQFLAANSLNLNLETVLFRLYSYEISVIDKMTTIINDRNKLIPPPKPE